MRYKYFALLTLFLLVACGNQDVQNETGSPEVNQGLDEVEGTEEPVQEEMQEEILEDDMPEAEPALEETEESELDARVNELGIITANKDFTLIDANGYLDAFVNRKTYVIFDQDRSMAPIVGAAIELQSYFNNLDYVEPVPVSTEGKHIDDYLDRNLILLGNGCTNDLIKDVLDDEDCLTGLEPDQVRLRLGNVDDKRVLLIIGYDDESAYNAVKKLVAEDVSWNGEDTVLNV